MDEFFCSVLALNAAGIWRFPTFPFFISACPLFYLFYLSTFFKNILKIKDLDFIVAVANKINN